MIKYAMSLIVLTNDDGVHAPGLKALREEIGKAHEVCIIAPDRERSASGHSLTIDRPLKVNKLSEGVYSISGTPTDCVAVGVSKVIEKRPKLLISGINNGANLGDDVTYSGTVSAAIEGTILNIPSIAVSLHVERAGPLHFESAARVAAIAAEYVLEHSLPYDTLLNINVPNLPFAELAGIRFTRQGKRMYENAIKETVSPWGETFFWIGGGMPIWEHGDDTDMSAIREGWVSITPLHLDLTNYSALGYLKERWNPTITPD